LGFAAEVAYSGNEAIKKIKSRSEPYHAILMDVQMHDMDGYETTRHIRAIEETKNFRHYIVCVSANAFSDDRVRSLDAGMDDYISKPVNPETLAEKLRQMARVA
jgi:CheY-like chemotaxis protein